eukprot:s2708_g10.t1
MLGNVDHILGSGREALWPTVKAVDIHTHEPHGGPAISRRDLQAADNSERAELGVPTSCRRLLLVFDGLGASFRFTTVQESIAEWVVACEGLSGLSG